MDTLPPPPADSGPSATISALRVVLLYAVCAALWIFLSDTLLAYVISEPQTIVLASLIKGWVFVAITSLLLFVLLRKLHHLHRQVVQQHDLAENLQLLQQQQRLAEAQRIARLGIWELDLETRGIVWSAEVYRLYGVSPESYVPTLEAFIESIHPDDRAAMRARIADRTAYGDPSGIEFRAIRQDGTVRIFHGLGRIERDAAGRARRIVGTVQDITERKQTEQMLTTQRQVLQMVAAGAPLPDTLDTLARAIEAQAPGMLASTLLLDDNGLHLRHICAPSLPDAYVRAIDGQPIGARAGSCGTAAWRREPVFVEDIASDPLWADYRAIALAHKLRACWSTPIMGPANQVLGTFALYYHQPALPTEYHQRLITLAADSAAIAITRQREEETLRKSTEKIRLLLESTSEAIYGIDRSGNCTFVNPACLHLLGYDREDDLIGQHIHEMFHHTRADGTPYPAQECRSYAAYLNDTGVHVGDEVFWRKDGTSIPVEYWAHPIRSENKAIGAVVVWRDISTQKAAAESLQRQTEELQSRLDELERFNRATVGRELDMIELKRQVNDLSRELGRAAPFRLDFVAGEDPPRQKAPP